MATSRALVLLVSLIGLGQPGCSEGGPDGLAGLPGAGGQAAVKAATLARSWACLVSPGVRLALGLRASVLGAGAGPDAFSCDTANGSAPGPAPFAEEPAVAVLSAPELVGFYASERRTLILDAAGGFTLGQRGPRGPWLRGHFALVRGRVLLTPGHPEAEAEGGARDPSALALTEAGDESLHDQAGSTFMPISPTSADAPPPDVE